MKRLGPVVIVDASVAVQWYVPERDSERAHAVAEGRKLLAPDLLAMECANVLWKYVRRGEASRTKAAEALDLLRTAPISWVRDLEMVSDAQRLSIELNHPVYDCLYLALALRNGVPVVTADRRFAQLAQRSAAFSERLIALDSLA